MFIDHKTRKEIVREEEETFGEVENTKNNAMFATEKQKRRLKEGQKEPAPGMEWGRAVGEGNKCEQSVMTHMCEDAVIKPLLCETI